MSIQIKNLPLVFLTVIRSNHKDGDGWLYSSYMLYVTTAYGTKSQCIGETDAGKSITNTTNIKDKILELFPELDNIDIQVYFGSTRINLTATIKDLFDPNHQNEIIPSQPQPEAPRQVIAFFKPLPLYYQNFTESLLKKILENAPSWARYFAVDRDCRGYYYEDRPARNFEIDSWVKEAGTNGMTRSLDLGIRLNSENDTWDRSLIKFVIS